MIRRKSLRSLVLHDIAGLCGRDAFRRLTGLGLNRSDCLDIISYAAGVPYHEAAPRLDRLFLPDSVYQSILSKLAEQMPVAYITGRKEFYGMEFRVTPHTLIPRPDTEVLVDAVLAEAAESARHRILDLCTGSGCVLLALLHHLPAASGMGLDISEAAVEIARSNADRFALADRAGFMVSDILQEGIDYKNFDIITANPPYLSAEEYDAGGLSLAFEPRSAFVAEEDGYFFYKYLLYTMDKLSNNISLFLEVGHTQSEKVREMAHGRGYKTDIRKDLQGHVRMVKAYKEVKIIW